MAEAEFWIREMIAQVNLLAAAIKGGWGPVAIRAIEEKLAEMVEHAKRCADAA